MFYFVIGYIPVSDCVAMRATNGDWLYKHFETLINDDFRSSYCGNQFPFVCSANPIYNISTTQSNSCSSGWTLYDKTFSCYRSFIYETFDQAQLACSSLGANLTSVTSADENTFLIGWVESILGSFILQD